MLDPKEMKKGGFGAFAALFSERWATRHPAPSPEEPAATTPAPTVPAATDGAPDSDVSR